MVDVADVELHLIPTPTSPDLPLSASWGGGVGEKCLGRLMVLELFQHVGQKRAIIGEQATLKSFHWKEQLGKTFQKLPPTRRANVIVVST
jgi:hypothetical protein